MAGHIRAWCIVLPACWNFQYGQASPAWLLGIGRLRTELDPQYFLTLGERMDKLVGRPFTGLEEVDSEKMTLALLLLLSTSPKSTSTLPISLLAYPVCIGYIKFDASGG
jgi:hypothetical protein